MELWIRSQNGNVLMPVKSKLELFYDAPEHILIISNDTILGAYKSRDRVLEILDEIQNILQPPMNFIVSQHIDFDNNDGGLIGYNILKEEPKIEKISDAIIYQMPKE